MDRGDSVDPGIAAIRSTRVVVLNRTFFGTVNVQLLC